MSTSTFTRETTVRAISRGGDFIIANGCMFVYGDSAFWIATVAGTAWNGTSDFIGQRRHTYPKPRRTNHAWRQIIPYAILRLSIGALGFGTLSFMFFYLSLPYYIGSLTTTVVFWFISYKVTRVFFTGSSHGMPRWFRHPWVSLRCITRKRVRFS